MSWRDAYARPTTPFGAKGPHYDPRIGHRGQDYSLAAHAPVPAYEAGYVSDITIDHITLGSCVSISLDAGRYAGWAHLTDITVTRGQRIVPGQVIGYVAGSGDRPGQAWTGPHIHTTLSDDHRAALGYLPLHDPLPRIRAALGAGPAGEIGDQHMSPDEYRAAQWYTDPTDALYPGDDRWRLEDREAYAQGVRLALKNIELKIDRLLERLG